MFSQMLLHNPVETPKIAEFAFTVTPGEETRVIIAPRILSASKSIISVPLKKRKCFFTSERKLRYYRTYTQKNCILECEANFTQKICHCVQYYMPSNFWDEFLLVIFKWSFKYGLLVKLNWIIMFILLWSNMNTFYAWVHMSSLQYQKLKHKS